MAVCVMQMWVSMPTRTMSRGVVESVVALNAAEISGTHILKRVLSTLALTNGLLSRD